MGFEPATSRPRAHGLHLSATPPPFVMLHKVITSWLHFLFPKCVHFLTIYFPWCVHYLFISQVGGHNVQTLTFCEKYQSKTLNAQRWEIIVTCTSILAITRINPNPNYTCLEAVLFFLSISTKRDCISRQASCLHSQVSEDSCVYSSLPRRTEMFEIFDPNCHIMGHVIVILINYLPMPPSNTVQCVPALHVRYVIWTIPPQTKLLIKHLTKYLCAASVRRHDSSYNPDSDFLV